MRLWNYAMRSPAKRTTTEVLMNFSGPSLGVWYLTVKRLIVNVTDKARPVEETPHNAFI